MKEVCVGILGDGQLGRMLALAALRLGVRVRFISSGSRDETCPFRDRLPPAALHDTESLHRFMRSVDVLTFESENVDDETLERLARLQDHLAPSADALRIGQDRMHEKRFLREGGLATAPWRAAQGADAIATAADELGYPCIVKLRRNGFDGRGQHWMRQASDLADLPPELAEAPVIVEGAVAFERELSQVCARGRDGQIVFWPLSENIHHQGILVRTRAPARDVDEGALTDLRDRLRSLLEEIAYVGTFAIELFQQGERLIANEVAPRVHNSGHWTQDGASLDQFEAHIRAITGLPLHAPTIRGECLMINLIGALPDLSPLLSLDGVHLHLYDKAQRPGRKVGHLNLVAPDATSLRALEERVDALLRSA